MAGAADEEGADAGEVELAASPDAAYEQRRFLRQAAQMAPVAELMLESYMAELMEVVGSATRLQSELDVLDGQFSLMLASTRNRLLRLDLAVSLVALTLTAAGAVGGIFGMNVP